MKQTKRLYGPYDSITLPEIRQTGAAGIVTALHDIPYGRVWPEQAIIARRDEVFAAGLTLGRGGKPAGARGRQAR